MPDRHKNFVLSDQRAASVRIHSCRITNVIAVRLKPSNDWIFFAENPGPAVERAVFQRSVVADLERSTIIVISPPRSHRDLGRHNRCRPATWDRKFERAKRSGWSH